MATFTAPLANKIAHFNNITLGTSNETVTLSGQMGFICLQNEDDTDDLRVSFDGGTTFFDIPKLSNLVVPVSAIASFIWKASNGTVPARSIYGQEI